MDFYIAHGRIVRHGVVRSPTVYRKENLEPIGVLIGAETHIDPNGFVNVVGLFDQRRSGESPGPFEASAQHIERGRKFLGRQVAFAGHRELQCVQVYADIVKSIRIRESCREKFISFSGLYNGDVAKIATYFLACEARVGSVTGKGKLDALVIGDGFYAQRKILGAIHAIDTGDSQCGIQIPKVRCCRSDDIKVRRENNAFLIGGNDDGHFVG